MGVLFMYSPDVGSLIGQIALATLSTSTARTGSYSTSFASGYHFICPFPADNEIYYRQGIYQSDTEKPVDIKFRDVDTVQMVVRLDFSAGIIYLYRGDAATLVAQSATGAITPSTWHCIEVRLLVHDSTGLCQIRVDGVQVIGFAGDTQAGSNAQVTNVMDVQLTGVTPGHFGDDYMVRDDGWCGIGGLHILTPTANGTDTDWTPSAGNAYECVDEIPPSTADYISEDKTGAGRHLFAMSNLPAEIDVVTAVQVSSFIHVPSASSIQVGQAVKSGATTDVATGQGVSVTPRLQDDIWDDDPNTASEWTVSAVNALEAGVDVTS